MNENSIPHSTESSANTVKTKPLGQRLLEAGLITKAQLDLALREQKRLGIYLGDSLTNLGFVTQDIIASVLAEETKAEMVELKNSVIDQEVIKLIPYDLAKMHHVAPLSIEGKVLTVAMSDTLNVLAIDAIEHATGLNVDVVAASSQDILDTIERHYAQASTIEETIDRILDTGSDALGEDGSEKAPMIRLVDQIIAQAVSNQATDIHIEPDEKMIRVRSRVDGIMRQDLMIPKPLQSAVIARLKIMGNLNVTERNIPQDGRISFHLGLRKIDLRLSTMPTAHGENVVMRVLDKDNIELLLPSLGFTEENQKKFEEAVECPYGIILVTGPTGSGKTSTLYASMGLIDTFEKSVFTLEDPIEYQFPIIRQTQVQPEVGMTFASGLRALLRQDPDVIMVGEIRDAETAELAVRSALTGHLVFSSLHTNDAISAIPRLLDMGVEPFLLTSALTCIIGQRLARRICSACKKEIKNPEKILNALDVSVSVKGKLRLWEGEGCDVCSHSGYKGRIGLVEVLRTDNKLHDIVANGAKTTELKKFVKESGTKTMREDGLIKAFKGITTIQEVWRVIA